MEIIKRIPLKCNGMRLSKRRNVWSKRKIQNKICSDAQAKRTKNKWLPPATFLDHQLFVIFFFLIWTFRTSFALRQFFSPKFFAFFHSIFFLALAFAFSSASVNLFYCFPLFRHYTYIEMRWYGISELLLSSYCC